MRAAFALLLLAAACRPPAPPPDTAEGAYRSFNAALQRGNDEAAWKALSSATQKAMEARAKAIAEASKGAVQDDPRALLFQGRPGVITGLTQLGTDGGVTVLEVATASGTREVKMVKDSGGWFVDLTENL